VSVTAAGGLLFYALLGSAVSGAAGLLLLAVLGRLAVRQHAYEDAPQTHRGKTGTPTMGGIAFVAALVVGLAVDRSVMLTNLVLLVVLCAGIGAIDDIIKVRGGANRGLPGRTKLLATALAATLFLRAIDAAAPFLPGVVFHAGAYTLIVPHWLFFVLGVLAITGTVHAVNLTDGLDGLAAGTMIPPLAVLALIAADAVLSAAPIAASVGVGACAAFLIFNRHPARLFMGDTGSLALGALLSGVAIVSGEMLLLLVVGAVFVAEAVSVILQVAYFKTTGGKRIFRMSPLHHHFEMVGWPETKVTVRFWLASLLCSLVGWAIVR
jgi:phospho-N-acetylmuramoyl-pentapeptide-transferase